MPFFHGSPHVEDNMKLRSRKREGGKSSCVLKWRDWNTNVHLLQVCQRWMLWRLHENGLCSCTISGASENCMRTRHAFVSFSEIAQVPFKNKGLIWPRGTSSRPQRPVNRKRTLPEDKWSAANPMEHWITGTIVTHVPQGDCSRLLCLREMFVCLFVYYPVFRFF